MKKYCNSCFKIFSTLLILASLTTVKAQDKSWKVWVKTSPCSGRTDWVSVAKDNPTGGGNFFYLASDLFPGTGCSNTANCTFDEANTVASTLRGSSEFSKYCCADYSVWKNNQTGKMSVVLGKMSTAGYGWDLVKGNLCCEEAEALSGITGACSGANNTNQAIISKTKCYPGSYAAWNSQSQRVECFCNPGLVWNSTRTACIDPQQLVKQADCSGYPGSYAAWNTQTQRVECFCPVGTKWNENNTACVPDVQKTDNVTCWPGSYAAWNAQTQRTECYCKPGLVWNSTRTACVKPEDLVTAADCSGYPGTYAAWNAQTQRTECFCKPGLIWNSTRTACIDPQELVKTSDCSAYPGSQAIWNSQTQQVECACPAGKTWNSNRTACVDNATQVNCWPGSYAAFNSQTNRTECFCNPGLVWNSTKTACVEPDKTKNGNGSGGGNATWVLVSTTVNPPNPKETWRNNEWNYSAESPSAHYSIYNGGYTADFSWTAPPQQFSSSGFTVSMNVQGKTTNGQLIATIIGVSASGLSSNDPEHQSASASGNGSASASKSVTFKPAGNPSEIEVKVGLHWAVTYTYKYKRQ